MGSCLDVFNVGNTGAMGTIEFETGLEQDLPSMLDRPQVGARHLAADLSPRMRR
jgi:hypothetical protein